MSLILDGENAWEYYPEMDENFCGEFYQRIAQDPDIRALTASEAMEAVNDQPTIEGIFPASWIRANFDVWIGDAEDVRAWDLLREAREAYRACGGASRIERDVACPRNGWRSESGLTNRFWPPRAATGAGGMGRSTARPMMRNSMRSTAST